MAKLTITDKIEVPNGIEVNLEETSISVKGPMGELKRRSFYPGLKISKLDSVVEFSIENASKREKMMMKTLEAHFKNMLKGVQEEFEYKLKICSGHFPMTVKQEENKIIIKNFLGEKENRSSKVLDEVKVEINKDIIVLTSNDIEAVGQTAANLEKATRIKNRDRRRFQDGIFIIEKSGVKI